MMHNKSAKLKHFPFKQNRQLLKIFLVVHVTCLGLPEVKQPSHTRGRGRQSFKSKTKPLDSFISSVVEH